MSATDKAAQEARRDARITDAERWRQLMDAIAWAEAQPTGQRNDPARRRAEEARKLGRATERR